MCLQNNSFYIWNKSMNSFLLPFIWPQLFFSLSLKRETHHHSSLLPWKHFCSSSNNQLSVSRTQNNNVLSRGGWGLHFSGWAQVQRSHIQSLAPQKLNKKTTWWPPGLATLQRNTAKHLSPADLWAFSNLLTPANYPFQFLVLFPFWDSNTKHLIKKKVPIKDEKKTSDHEDNHHLASLWFSLD